jgi:hypothetical protein
MNVIARQVSVASGKIPANPWGALNKSSLSALLIKSG